MPWAVPAEHDFTDAKLHEAFTQAWMATHSMIEGSQLGVVLQGKWSADEDKQLLMVMEPDESSLHPQSCKRMQNTCRRATYFFDKHATDAKLHDTFTQACMLMQGMFVG